MKYVNVFTYFRTSAERKFIYSFSTPFGDFCSQAPEIAQKVFKSHLHRLSKRKMLPAKTGSILRCAGDGTWSLIHFFQKFSATPPRLSYSLRFDDMSPAFKSHTQAKQFACSPAHTKNRHSTVSVCAGGGTRTLKPCGMRF